MVGTGAVLDAVDCGEGREPAYASHAVGSSSRSALGPEPDSRATALPHGRRPPCALISSSRVPAPVIFRISRMLREGAADRRDSVDRE